MPQIELTERVRQMMSTLQARPGDEVINAQNQIVLESGILLVTYSFRRNGQTAAGELRLPVQVSMYHNPQRMYINVTDTDERPAVRQDWEDELYDHGFRVQIDSESGIKGRAGSSGREDPKTSYVHLDIKAGEPRFPSPEPVEEKISVIKENGRIMIGNGTHSVIGKRLTGPYLPHHIGHSFAGITHFQGIGFDELTRGDAPISYLIDKVLRPLGLRQDVNYTFLIHLFPSLREA